MWSLPERKRWVKSHAGTRTRLESVTLEHPLVSNNFNLCDVLSILCIELSSTNGWQTDIKLLVTQAILNSSNKGKPGEAICSFKGVGIRHNWLLVILKTRNFWQPSCSFSICKCPVAATVLIFEKSSNSKFGQFAWKQYKWWLKK